MFNDITAAFAGLSLRVERGEDVTLAYIPIVGEKAAMAITYIWDESVFKYPALMDLADDLDAEQFNALKSIRWHKTAKGNSTFQEASIETATEKYEAIAQSRPILKGRRIGDKELKNTNWDAIIERATFFNEQAKEQDEVILH